MAVYRLGIVMRLSGGESPPFGGSPFGTMKLPSCCPPLLWSAPVGARQAEGRQPRSRRAPRPFEEWIEKGHQRHANLCGAYARPTDERFLVRGGEGYNQGHLYTLPRHEGMWRGSVLSDVWG